MAEFPELEEALDEDLVLPIRGRDGELRKYRIPAPTWVESLRARAMGHIADAGAIGHEPDAEQVEIAGKIDDQSVHDFALTPEVHQQMITDGIGLETFERAVTAALFFRMGNTEAAKAVWSGKAQNQRIRSAKTGGEAGATQRASTSGTSTRRKSPKK